EYGGVAEVEFNAARHVRTFLRWCFGDGDLEALLSFEQDVTAVRVETGFALLPTLGAYRIGDIELWKWTLEVIGRPNAFATVDDATELLELWSTYGERARNVTVASYLAQEQRRTSAEAADRRDLLDDLIHGRLDGTEITTRLGR